MYPDAIKRDFDDTRNLLDGLVAANILPGASVLILEGGEELFFHSVGWMDIDKGSAIRRDTLFRIYSMTKPVTAAAVMRLVDDGIVSLDDPVERYIPEFAALEVCESKLGEAIRTVPAGPMTVRDLLTHSAGFTYWFQEQEPAASLYDDRLGAGRHEIWRFVPELGGLDGLARNFAGVPLASQPGARWHYSMSLEVAGIVIERASGKSLDAFMEERIFAPLGMADTGFAVPGNKAERLASLYGPLPNGGIELLERGDKSPLLRPVPGLSGGGGLVSTIDDYARFAEMLRCEGELEGHRILSAASVKAMMSQQLEPEKLAELPMLAAFGLGGSGEGLGFGLGGAVVKDPALIPTPAYAGEYSWGGAASTTFWVDPVNAVSVVFMTQLIPPSSEMLRDKLHGAIYRDAPPPDRTGDC
jgi:CubicO group peptidase (beta-lactamase class C family)